MSRVSVLVPAYNDAPYLDAALRSITAQTLGDFEVVVSDDGSTDDTAAIAEGWAARDRRFRVLRSATNRGMTENWNHALAAARGELVAKLDADDAWEPSFLEALVPELDQCDVLAAFCRTIECDDALRPRQPWGGERAFAAYGLDVAARQVRPGHAWFAMSLDDHQLWHSNAFVVRRRDLVAVRGWDERFRCAADTDLILRLLERDAPVVHRPETAAHYRRRSGSVSAVAAAHGWKGAEAVAVALASLDRCGRRLARRSRAVRQNWWRLWRAAGPYRTENGRAALLSAGAGAVAELLGQLAAPPLWIRTESALRARAWAVRRALSPAATERTS